MPELMKQIEAVPDSWPVIDSSGWSAEAQAVDSHMLWQRIEAYIAFRFSARDVIWIVEGAGDWSPSLAPCAVDAEEVWNGTAWESASLNASPYGGYTLPDNRTYRFTATVGAGPVPSDVTEAFRRLAEYLAATPAKSTILPGGDTARVQTGELVLSYKRDAAWVAKAIDLSGAGDLLRKYRRVS